MFSLCKQRHFLLVTCMPSQGSRQEGTQRVNVSVTLELHAEQESKSIKYAVPVRLEDKLKENTQTQHAGKGLFQKIQRNQLSCAANYRHSVSPFVHVREA